MALPAISLAVGQIAAYMRLLRSDMIATLQEDFILMAKAKGITNRRILWRHALRPSSLTLLTVAGLNVGALIGGTVVIEIIFGLPGMGTLLYTAIAERQFVDAPEPGRDHRDRVRARERASSTSSTQSSIRGCAMLAPSPSTDRRRPSSQLERPARAAPAAKSRWRRPRAQAARHRRVARDRLAGHRDRSAAIFIPIFLHSNPNANALAGHSSQGFFKVASHPLGVRPQRQRHAARSSPRARATRWSSALGAVSFGLLIGGTLGLIAGYYQRHGRQRAHDASSTSCSRSRSSCSRCRSSPCSRRPRSTPTATSSRRRRPGGWSC